MSENQSKVITSRQARGQINHFGRSLLLYILGITLLSYGSRFLHEAFALYPFPFDYEVFELLVRIVLLILATILFRISSAFLRLKIKDYMIKPKNFTFGTFIVYLCLTISINLVTLSFSTLIYFFSQNNIVIYSYLGVFTSQMLIIKNILYFICFVLVRPICQEYIFRGIIQRQLGHYGRYFGVLGSAFLFAIAQDSLANAVPAFFIGWFLALMTLQYHSIKPAIYAHIGLSLFSWFMEVVPGEYLWVTLVMIVIIFAIAILSIFRRKEYTQIARWGATEGKLWRILLTSHTIILCILVFIANVVLSFITI